MFKIAFFVPAEHAEPVKTALFAAGAGRFDRYELCAWQTAGTGQFRPLPGSTPFIGTAGDLERVDELRVEMICEDAQVRSALQALVAAHPYEEPAYEVYQIWTGGDLPAGV